LVVKTGVPQAGAVKTPITANTSTNRVSASGESFIGFLFAGEDFILAVVIVQEENRELQAIGAPIFQGTGTSP
jgi:hypothetical protein